MKPSLFFILFLFSFSISLLGMTPEETKAARRTWLNGYEYYEKAEKALDNEKLRESHALFKESIKIFTGIKTKYPGWSSSMIDYRIKLCDTKIKQIEKQLGKQNIKITDNDVDKENIYLKKRVSNLEDELKNIKRKHAITLSSLESARREAARNSNSSDEMEKILKEKTDLEKRYALLVERNKKLQMETGTVTAETAEESKKALDASLLEVEFLKKQQKSILEKLKKEQDRFNKIARKNTQIRYENKVLLENEKKNQSLMDELNGKLSEHNEIVARWEKEKIKFGTSLNETNKLLKEKDKKINELQKKIDELRNVPDSDTITKQLENEKELLSKDIEVVNLQLAKELKEKKNVIEEKNKLLGRIEGLETALAKALQDQNNSKNDLETFKKKVLVSDTIIKKQDKVISEQKAANSKLKKEFELLADKYKNIDKKEKEFTALANDSLKIENENSMLKDDLKKLKIKSEQLTEEVKKSEINKIQLQKEIEKIISDNKEEEKNNFTLNEKFRTEIFSLNKKLKKLTNQLETDNKKVKMMTAELISVNSLLSEKEKIIEEMKKEQQKQYIAQIKNIKEPEIATETPEYLTLKKENNANKEKLKLMEKELTALKANTPVNNKETLQQIRKMLDSAASAEENEKKEAATWYYEKVLEIDPENQTALNKLGYIQAGNGNYEEAIELLKRGLKSDPDDVDKLQVLSVCYIREKKFNDALSVASKANAVNPKNPLTLRYLGVIFRNLGLKAAAEKQFRESFKIDPTSSETALNSAILLISYNNRIKEAKLWYEKAIKLGAERDPGIEKIIKTAK